MIKEKKEENMSNPNKSVWFSNGNKEYVQEQADKENKSFNKKVNEIIDADRAKKEKKEV